MFLLSWHHLHAYISQVKISQKYLDDLATESQDLEDCLCVSTSSSYNMRDPNDRIAMTRLILGILCHKMTCWLKHKKSSGIKPSGV